MKTLHSSLSHEVAPGKRLSMVGPSVWVVRVFLCVVLVALLSGPFHLALAHPGIEVRIAAINERIAADPNNAGLYLKRGELHREHQEWDAALSDYDRAAAIDPELATVHLARGLLFLDIRQLGRARLSLDRFLELAPESASGLLTRARVLAALGEHLAAAHDFDNGIARTDRRTPEMYIARARVLAAAGREHLGRALSGLELGMNDLGRVFTLQSYAIELESARGNHQGALDRLDELARWLPREELLRRRGDICKRAGDRRSAVDAYREALRLIDSLPPDRHDAQPVVELRSQLASSLRALGEPEAEVRK